MTTRCLIGVVVAVFSVAEAAMAEIDDNETEPTTKISNIAIDDERPFHKIMLSFLLCNGFIS